MFAVDPKSRHPAVTILAVACLCAVMVAAPRPCAASEDLKAQEAVTEESTPESSRAPRESRAMAARGDAPLTVNLYPNYIRFQAQNRDPVAAMLLAGVMGFGVGQFYIEDWVLGGVFAALDVTLAVAGVFFTVASSSSFNPSGTWTVVGFSAAGFGASRIVQTFLAARRTHTLNERRARKLDLIPAE